MASATGFELPISRNRSLAPARGVQPSEPVTAEPVAAEPLAAPSAKAKPSKSATSEDLLRAATTDNKSPGIGMKPSPYNDPFESDRTHGNPAEPPLLPPAPSVSVPPSEPVAAPSNKATPPKSATVEELLKAATTDKSPGIGMKPLPFFDPFEPERTDKSPSIGKKPSPYSDPFEHDSTHGRPAESPAKPKPPKARPQRQIIEDL
jgi:hypothetical protein